MRRRAAAPFLVAALGLLGLPTSLAGSASAAPAFAVRGDTVVAGHARFQVLSSTLVRIEYASDDRFEDRPTMTVPVRRPSTARFTVTDRDGVLRIATPRMTVTYRTSGVPNADTLTITARQGGRTYTGHPSFPARTTYHGPPLEKATMTPAYVQGDPSYRLPSRGNLGGWYRALDGVSGPVRLHDGLIDRRGWHLLDDTQTVVTTDRAPGFVARDLDGRTYRDGYLFGYGHDYARGLRDLSRLVGRAPLLPRNAFAPWWSKYAADPQSSYPPLVRRFARHGVRLGVIDVDTDAKSPHVWNGWGWTRRLFPDPAGFTDWAHRRGIHIGFNIHPSITVDDPAFLPANQTAGGTGPVGGLREDVWRCRAITFGTDMGMTGITSPPDPSQMTAAGTPDCRVFDWAKSGDQAAYARLHRPFTRAGVDFFWLDYCCDESDAVATGATDPWINRLYAEQSRARGSRWPVLSRVGSSLFDVDTGGPGIWAERRSTVHFTGDAASTWDTLRFETAFSPAEGNVGLPYVSHDIGGFLGDHLADDLYVRWVQAGAFAPVLRLHSDHGDRLPWQYGDRAERIASSFLRLRDRLVPYLYTVAHQAARTGLPMTRALYLQWPDREPAYRNPGEYLLGRDLLVAPVTVPGARPRVHLWVPPGRWTDMSTGHTFTGPGRRAVTVPLQRTLVLRRAGSILPLQDTPRHGYAAPPVRLTLDLAPGRRGSFTLYDDAGDGLGWLHGATATTTIRQQQRAAGARVHIGAMNGAFPGLPPRRTWTLRIPTDAAPRQVTVDGHPTTSWSWRRGTLVVRTGPLTTAAAHVVAVDGAATGG